MGSVGLPSDGSLRPMTDSSDTGDPVVPPGVEGPVDGVGSARTVSDDGCVAVDTAMMPVAMVT